MTITVSGGMTVTGGGFTAAGTNLLQVVDQVSGNVLTLPTGVSVSTTVTQPGTTLSVAFDGTNTTGLVFNNSNVSVIPVTVEGWFFYPTSIGNYLLSMFQNLSNGSGWGIGVGSNKSS
jgi:hypothetical protein